MFIRLDALSERHDCVFIGSKVIVVLLYLPLKDYPPCNVFTANVIHGTFVLHNLVLAQCLDFT